MVSASYDSRTRQEGPAGLEREETAIPRKVFVGNLSFNTTQDRLNEAFASAGQVVSVHIGTDRETGRSRGFAFVEVSSGAGAPNALSTVNEFELRGRTVRVKT